MLTIAKCRDLDYYEREVIEGREEYLSEGGNAPGQWVGSLASADGYSGAFDSVFPAAATISVPALVAAVTAVARTDVFEEPPRLMLMIAARDGAVTVPPDPLLAGSPAA